MLFRSNHVEIPDPGERDLAEDSNALGRELLSLVSWAVEHNIDPEAALRKAALEYRERLNTGD